MAKMTSKVAYRAIGSQSFGWRLLRHIRDCDRSPRDSEFSATYDPL